MTDEEKKQAVHEWMRTLEARVLTLENLLLELLMKFKAAGLIVEEDEDEAVEEE